MRRTLLLMSGILFCCYSCSKVEETASEFVYMENGSLYQPDGKELSLWGVNYQAHISWEYEYYMTKLGIPKDPLVWKRMVDQSFGELKKMRCQVVRYQITPADFTDSLGNLIETFYLDMLDYALAVAKKNGIRVYITLLNHMHLYEVEGSFMEENFQNAIKIGGAQSWWYQQANMMLNRQVVNCSKNYINLLLNRTNPYLEEKYNEDTNIVLWEVMNEPLYLSYEKLKIDTYLYSMYQQWLTKEGLTEDDGAHYTQYRKEAILNYLNEMHGTIRASGGKQPIVWSCNWHNMIKNNEDVFEAIAESDIEVVSFCNYPGQDMCKAPYQDNPVDLSREDFSDWLTNCYSNRDWYGWAMEEQFMNKAKIVYEFETFYNQSAYLYPAQAKLFRSLGAQVACMWHYLMPDYAEYVNGSHMLNLNCTPRKAASFAVAGEVFNSLPLYGNYDGEQSVEDETGNYMFSYEKDLSIYSSEGIYLYSGTVPDHQLPKPSAGVKDIVGYGNSPLVKYDGTGVYTLGISDYEMHISIEPDHHWLKDPCGRDWLKGIVTELDHYASHTFEVIMEDWEVNNCEVYRLENGYKVKQVFLEDQLRFTSTPGEYLICKSMKVESRFEQHPQ